MEGIADVRDESDRFGMRIVIVLKRDASPQVVLNSLYKQTQLQVSTGITFLALDDGTPKIMNLKEILDAYVKHQNEVIVRRTRYLLNKANERAHLLQGLVIALANIDEVINIIRKSKDTPEARARLMENFLLSEKQANAILDMKLARLNALEVEKIRDELNEIELAIADYNDILARPERVREIIKEELLDIKDKYGDPRRSELSYDLGEINVGDLIPKEDVVITTTHMGYIKRLGVKEYKAQNRGGVGITAHKAKEEDFVTKMFVTHSHDDLLFFSNTGRVYCLKAYEVPEAQRATKGRAMVNLLPLSADEKITAYLPVHDYSEGYIVMATKQGLIKKCSLSEFERIRVNGKIAITLTDGDEMLSADITTGENEILMACTSGKCIRFSEQDVRKTGRGSMGVKSIALDEGEVVVDMEVVRNANAEVVTITEKGFGKRTALEEYRLQGRAGKGIKAGNFDENTGNVVNMKLINPEEENDMIIIADTGIMIRIRVEEISKIGRATKGVKVMRLKGEGKIVSCAIIPHEDLDDTKLVGENAELANEQEDAPVTEEVTAEQPSTDNE